MKIQQISIFVENRPGSLADVTEAIGKAGVNIRALSIADATDFGILRLIVDKPETAIQVLKEQRITFSLTDVIAVKLDDVPGGFTRTVKMISDSGINIEYMYAFVNRVEGQAVLILRIEEMERSIEILKKQGVCLLSGEQVYNM